MFDDSDDFADRLGEDLEEAAAAATLDAGRLTFDQLLASPEVVEILTEYGIPLGSVDAYEALDEALLFSSAVIYDEMTDQVANGNTLWEGRTLTHRITDDDAVSLDIDAYVDLFHLIGWRKNSGVRSIRFGGDGTEIPVDVGTMYWPFKEVLASVDPALLTAGSLIGVTRRGSVLEVSTITELADATAVVRALGTIFERSDPTIGFELLDEAGVACLREAEAFQVPTVPFSEILASIGFDRRGHFYGPAATEWETPGVRRRKLEADRRRQVFGLDAAAEADFQLAFEAWTNVVLQREREETPEELANSLSHPAVFDAVWEEVASFSKYLEMVEGYIAKAATGNHRRTAYPKALLGLAHEHDDPLEAELHYKSALLVDPKCDVAHVQLAFIEIDRGDYSTAVRHLQSLTRTDASGLIEALRAGTDATMATGRNDLCPCGSGKKYKKCHQGSALPGAVGGFRLADRLTFFVSKTYGDSIHELADIAGGYSDRFIDDLVLFEGDALLAYVAKRADLIPPDDLESLLSWLVTERALYEITDVEPGQTISLRSVRTGEQFVVIERTMSESIESGGYVLTRIALDPDPILVGMPITVPLIGRESLLMLLDDDPTAEDFAAWYGQLVGPPSISNREGHPMAPRFVSVAVDTPIDDTRSWLDEVASPVDDRWNWMLKLDESESIVVATITLDDSEPGPGFYLEFEVNSAERAERVLEAVLDQHPSAIVVADDLIDLADLGSSIDDSESIDPADEAQLAAYAAEYMADYERRWLDMDIPALGGLTPRQAAADPTMRDDLRRLLLEMPKMEGGMNRDAIAAQLDLEL